MNLTNGRYKYAPRFPVNTHRRKRLRFLRSLVDLVVSARLSRKYWWKWISLTFSSFVSVARHQSRYVFLEAIRRKMFRTNKKASYCANWNSDLFGEFWPATLVAVDFPQEFDDKWRLFFSDAFFYVRIRTECSEHGNSFIDAYWAYVRKRSLKAQHWKTAFRINRD